MVGSQRIATNDETGTKWHVKDHLQSTSITLDDAGNLLERVRYAPFGAERERTGSYTSSHTYTDQVGDQESELMYYGARYYSPSLRTFTSPDPVAVLQPEVVLRDQTSALILYPTDAGSRPSSTGGACRSRALRAPF